MALFYWNPGLFVLRCRKVFIIEPFLFLSSTFYLNAIKEYYLFSNFRERERERWETRERERDERVREQEPLWCLFVYDIHKNIHMSIPKAQTGSAAALQRQPCCSLVPVTQTSEGVVKSELWCVRKEPLCIFHFLLDYFGLLCFIFKSIVWPYGFASTITLKCPQSCCWKHGEIQKRSRTKKWTSVSSLYCYSLTPLHLTQPVNRAEKHLRVQGLGCSRRIQMLGPKLKSLAVYRL